MKVGIIGNYGHENNGDEAILSGIIKQLTTQFHCTLEDITVFSNQPSLTESLHGVHAVPLIHKTNKGRSLLLTIRKSYAVMKSLDLLIVGGGNLLMDLYKRDAPLYGTLAWLGKRAGAKVLIYGVGAGPIDTKLGKFFIKKMLNVASGVSVRDPKSKALLEGLNTGSFIRLAEDPAFSLAPEQKKVKTEAIRHIGVTCVPYFDGKYWPSLDVTKNENYLKGMAEGLDRVIRATGATITFYSTKYPQDVEVTKQVRALMAEASHVKVIEDALTPKELIRVSSEQDLIIGTRLHSLILSIVSATPIIGVSYQAKVRDLMSAHGLGEFILSIDNVSNQPNFFLEQVTRLNQDWNHWQDEFVLLSNQLREQASQGIANLLETDAEK